MNTAISAPRAGPLTRVLGAYIVLLVVVFVPAAAWRDAQPFVLVRRALEIAASFAQVLPLCAGALYGLAAVRHLEAGNRARPAWLLHAVWLAGFAVGEGILAFHALVLHTEPPVPSWGDAFFFIGYAGLISALIWFVRVYVTSGLALGSKRQPVVIALVCAGVLAAIAFFLLGPAARAAKPLPEKVVAIGYPILDFVVLVPTAILLRLTSRFHGGHVWRAWASILAAFVVLAAADVAFAYFDLETMRWLDLLMRGTFAAGYAIAAHGAALQYELIKPTPALN